MPVMLIHVHVLRIGFFFFSSSSSSSSPLLLLLLLLLLVSSSFRGSAYNDRDNWHGFRLGTCYTNEKVGRCAKCSGLKQTEESCDYDSQCCSSFCKGTMRPGPGFDTVKQNGDKCYYNLECESGDCRGNWLGLRQGVCMLGVGGGAAGGGGGGADGSGAGGMSGALSGGNREGNMPCRYNKDCESKSCGGNLGGLRMGTCSALITGKGGGEPCHSDTECTYRQCVGTWGGFRRGQCAAIGESFLETSMHASSSSVFPSWLQLSESLTESLSSTLASTRSWPDGWIQNGLFPNQRTTPHPHPASGGGGRGRCGDRDYELQEALKKQCGDRCWRDVDCKSGQCKGAARGFLKHLGPGRGGGRQGTCAANTAVESEKGET